MKVIKLILVDSANDKKLERFEWAFVEEYADEAIALLNIAQDAVYRNVILNSLYQLRQRKGEGQ